MGLAKGMRKRKGNLLVAPTVVMVKLACLPGLSLELKQPSHDSKLGFVATGQTIKKISI